MLYFGAPSVYEIGLLRDEGVKRVLVSAAQRGFESVISTAVESGMEVFLDSGAFSAMTRGVKLTAEWYAEVLGEHASQCVAYANLDSIGDAQATRANQEYLERSGFRPLPVYHYGEPDEILAGMCGRYDYVGLGGLVRVMQGNALAGRRWIASVTRRFPQTRFHGFGVGATREDIGLYSSDSTTWLMGSKFGKQIGRVREFRDQGAYGLFWKPEELKRHNIRAMLWLEENMSKPDMREHLTLFDVPYRECVNG